MPIVFKSSSRLRVVIWTASTNVNVYGCLIKSDCNALIRHIIQLAGHNLMFIFRYSNH